MLNLRLQPSKILIMKRPLVLKSRDGRLAQLVEHLVYTEGVGSSSLSTPTILKIDAGV
jgi:hypothetical protein